MMFKDKTTIYNGDMGGYDEIYNQQNQQWHLGLSRNELYCTAKLLFWYGLMETIVVNQLFQTNPYQSFC
jgi:hypothetical protein